MVLRHVGIALISCALLGLSRPAHAQNDAAPSVENAVSFETMRQTVIGTFHGTFNNCHVRKGFELKLQEGKRDPLGMGLVGTLKTFDLPGETLKTTQLDWPVAGVQYSQNGVVNLHALAPVIASDTRQGGVIGNFLNHKLNDTPNAEKHIPFDLSFARDFEGKGWVGVLDSKRFDCHALSLLRDDGTTSASLPQLDPKLAMTLARLTSMFVFEEQPYNGATGVSPQLQPPSLLGADTREFTNINWLELAAKLGSPEAVVAMGRVYEFGMGVPIDKQIAFRYYSLLADRNNASAQAGISRIYSAGAGIPRDEAASKRYADLSRATKSRLAEVCAMPPVVETAVKMIYAEAEAGPTTLGGQLGSVMMSNQSVDPGKVAIQRVVPVGVWDAEHPFYCKFIAKRIDPKVTDQTPYRRYRVDDGNGHVYYYDNHNEREEGEANAAIVTYFAKITPFLEVLRLEPLGAGHYRVALMQPQVFGDLAPVYETELTLSQPSELSRSGDRKEPAAVPLPASSRQSAQPATAATTKASSSAAPDATQVDAAIDAMLIAWSRSWFTDRYVAGSAHVSKRECASGGCRLSGAFTFLRYGTPLNIPLSATSQDGEGGSRVTLLCYVDTTTGQQSCTR